jgi:hypothetical protein
MKERPIIFSAESVRAILEGRKTQTRRVVTADNSTVCGYSTSRHKSLWTGLVWDERVYKDKGPHILHPSSTEYLHVPWVHPEEGDDGRVFRVRCKYDIGDRLWVRETWMLFGLVNDQHAFIHYKASQERNGGERVVQRPTDKPLYPSLIWRPPIFMPRWASRIDLEITGVRVARLQDISEEDAKAEGALELFTIPNPQILYPDVTGYRRGFLFLWNALNAKRGFGWKENPWVWVREFPKFVP